MRSSLSRIVLCAASIIVLAFCSLRASDAIAMEFLVQFGEVDSLSFSDTVKAPQGSIVATDSAFLRLASDSAQAQLGVPAASRKSVGLRWRRFCDSLNQGWVALAALTLPGSGQVINRDYWKIPIFYAGIAGFSYGAYHFNRLYQSLDRMELQQAPLDRLRHEDLRLRTKMARNCMIAGACITYVASVADALIAHSPDRQSPTAAMVSSALLPGLGQIYNRSFWKIPIIYGGLGYLIATAISNHQRYMRFERAYIAIADNDPSTIDEFNGSMPLQTLEYGSTFYRRYRDLSIIGVALVYALNVIDAYVDAHLFDWNVNEDVVLRTDPQLAWNHPDGTLGVVPMMQLSISF